MDFDDLTDDTTGATCTSDGAAYEPRRCVATKADGTPCGAWALTGSAYCYMHAPERAAERAIARARGGYARHGRKIREDPEDAAAELTLEQPADALRIIAAAIRDCGRLELSIARARTLGYLAGMALKAFEITELAARVESLEKILTQREGNP